MIVTLLAALQASAAPAQAAGPVADEVVVIGRKLQSWRANLRSTRGETRCATRRSSGDAAIDAIGCTAMLECWPAAKPRFGATQAKGLAAADRKLLMTQAEQAFGACVFPKRTALIEALADQRVAARTATAP